MRTLVQLVRRFQAWDPSPRLALPVNVALVFGFVLALRYSGMLQNLEFDAYDLFLRSRPLASTPGPIVLVEMTEADIQDPTLDYPLHDDKLAELLQRLQADRPAAIGLDLWRDLPVPKSGVGLPLLNHALKHHPNIVGAFTLGGIAPPAVLQNDPERVAFTDNFPPDNRIDPTIPKVRRALLFATSDSGETFDSLPFRLALLYLEQRGVHAEAVPDDPNAMRLGQARLQNLNPNFGPYVNADAGGWQLLLDFKCPTHFTRFSVREALAGHIPPGALRDRIVVIGMNAASVMDERVTPIRSDQRGLELQAIVVNQILRHALEGEPPLRSWTDAAENGWTLLWCVLGVLLGYRVRSPWRLVPLVAAGVLSLPAFAWLAFASGWWIPAITPLVAFVGATALTASYATSHERLMRGVLMKLYSRHVSKEIAESIWADRRSFLNGRRPLAQKLVVTVLFTDLKGFSTIAEQLEASRLYEWLNGYLGAMAQVIQDHGGVLKQFTGDGILALFGVPIPHRTREAQAADASAAVRCALAMGRRLAELRSEWQQRDLPPVSMRAGVYTGEVAAGSVGSDDRFEYAVVGDVVNTAARLETYDKSIADPDLLPTFCRLLVGGPTHELLGTAFHTREIGLLQVKGRLNLVPVFQVLEERFNHQAGSAEPRTSVQLAEAPESSPARDRPILDSTAA
jgi:adenylate cyclase